MKYEKQFMKDVFAWDVVNWQKALHLWETDSASFSGSELLAIGEKDGGLSLYFARRGASVTCTDLDGVSPRARQMHEAYVVSASVVYENANVLALPFPDNRFDIVVFKSVLGALREKESQLKAINEIHRVLKPGGKLLFAENLCGSRVHQWARKNFVRWGSYWRYLSLEETDGMFSVFASTRFATAGVSAAFGRSEAQRRLLGRIDTFIEKRLPREYHYILFGICKKKENGK